MSSEYEPACGSPGLACFACEGRGVLLHREHPLAPRTFTSCWACEGATAGVFIVRMKMPTMQYEMRYHTHDFGAACREAQRVARHARILRKMRPSSVRVVFLPHDRSLPERILWTVPVTDRPPTPTEPAALAVA